MSERKAPLHGVEEEKPKKNFQQEIIESQRRKIREQERKLAELKELKIR